MMEETKEEEKAEDQMMMISSDTASMERAKDDNNENGTDQGGDSESPNVNESEKEEHHSQEEKEGDNEDDNDDGDDGGAEEQEEPVVLSQSTRLKGYITFVVASAINYYDAYKNDVDGLPEVSNVILGTPTQRRYAMSVSMVTGILSITAIVLHFDRYTCLQKLWIKAFRPKSMIEFTFLVFLTLWWIIATWINTSISGIAGDGKNQYNLYFSTWVCCINAMWTLDRWLVAAGHSSFKSFMISWPHRAPGWIAVLFFSFIDLLSILDLFTNWEDATADDEALNEIFDDISDAQWQWLIFVAAFTLPPSAGFTLVELFRSTRAENRKSDCEIIFEGAMLFCLVCGWVPTVILSTAPGGVASLVGNAYFLTWASAVFVIETFFWWMHDWRKSIHAIVEQQREEYENHKQELLQKYLQEHTEEEEESKESTEEGTDDNEQDEDRRDICLGHRSLYVSTADSL